MEGSCAFCSGPFHFHKGLEIVLVLGKGEVANDWGRHCPNLHRAPSFTIVYYFDSIQPFVFCCFAEDFEKKKYPTLNMASILRATSIIGSRALKSSSEGTKHVVDILEHLSEDHTERSCEKVVAKVDKAKERVEKRKGKVEEPQKKRKLSHSSSTSEKFDTTVAYNIKLLSFHFEAYGGEKAN